MEAGQGVAKGSPLQMRVDSLEVLRGVAAMVVLVHHALGTIQLPRYYGTTFLWNFFSTGQFGVDVFFVLSGFIITLTNHRDGVGSRGMLKYGLRRFARIFPLYWIACLLYLPAAAVLGSGAGDGSAITWRSVIESVTLVPDPQPPILVVAWTLRFEIMFYLLYVPFLIRRSVGWWFWGVLSAVAVGGAWFGVEHASPWLAQLFSLRILEFLAGAVACECAIRGPVARPLVVAAFGAAGIVATAVLELNRALPAAEYGFLWYALFAVFLVYGMSCNCLYGGKLKYAKWLVTLGAYSYSVYLFHRPVQQGLVKLAVKLTGQDPGSAVEALVAIGVILLSLGAGMAVGKWVELPILNHFRRQVAKL